ncbi:LuxR C-terminal-related transcriptional regulator [Streptomyces sp. NPDC007355]|uniref:LuxR C-terminal-related transcriptional regulator n=1 Tax=Streptomyces sp. NPDC007355 TaxID=3364778 RepID=UPI0036AED264
MDPTHFPIPSLAEQKKSVEGGTPEAAGLIGREEEIRSARQFLNVSSSRAGILIAGPRGVGKSRLAQEVRAIVLKEQGFPVFEIATTGLSAAREAADALSSLARSATKNRRFLYIDGLENLPESIIEELVTIAQRRLATIVATVNTDSELPSQLHDLWKDQHLAVIELSLLDPSSSRRLAEAFSSGKLDRVLLSDLAALSQGSPLLLRELVNATELERYQNDPAAIPVRRLPRLQPLATRYIRMHKLAEIGQPAISLLEIIALVENAPLAVVRRHFSNDVLLFLEDLNLIRVDSSSNINSASLCVEQPLLAQVLVQSIPPLRAAAYLSAWLQEFPLNSQQSEFKRRIVNRHIDYGIPLPEELLLEVAMEALRENDLLAALRVADASWWSNGSLESAVARAMALLSAGEVTKLLEMLDQIEFKLGHLPAPLISWRVRAHLLSGKYEAAEGEMHRLNPTDRMLLSGMSAYLQGRVDKAILLCEPLTNHSDYATRVEAAVLIMGALCHQGRPLSALSYYEAYCEANASSDGGWALHADSLEEMHAMALHDAGMLEEAEGILRNEYHVARLQHAVRFDAQRGLALGFTLYERGKVAEARSYFTLSPAYQVGWRIWHYKARVYAALVDLCMSGQEQTKIEPEADSLSDIEPMGAGVHHAVASAWLAWGRGNSSAAAEILSTAAESAMRQGANADVAVVAHEMARMGLAEETSTELWDTPVEGPLLRARLEYAQALGRKDAKILGKAARAFGDCRAELYAAEAYAELSHLHSRNGKERAATGAVVQGRIHLSRCGSVNTPALRLLGQSATLTARERTIADMAARGFSDRDIAQFLTISPRTVGNTLYRVYRKLGIRGRQHLPQSPD